MNNLLGNNSEFPAVPQPVNRFSVHFTNR
ncbi:MAG: hypothetical protein JWQ03_1640, partial [Variovorax sp.]|nr:hypothetical protein [Variovorax sp.]